MTGNRGRIIGRIAGVAVASTLFTLFLHDSARSGGATESAGFGKGILHGILMPSSLPMLAIGKDVKIYATHNNGRPYNLGYTVGVNVCGAVFFGLLYRRLARWKKPGNSVQAQYNAPSNTGYASTDPPKK